MRSRLALVLFLLSIAASTRAQTDRSYPFRPGYVVTAEGDTLRGAVEDRFALDNARSIFFRSTREGESREVRPSAALGFGFDDGAYYVSREVRPEPDASPRAAFVRVLVDGPRSLYAHAYRPDQDRFYIEGDDFPIEGLYRVERNVYRDGRTVRRTQRLYAGTLTRAFQDCSASRNAAGEVRYTAVSLTRAVVGYNRCVDPDYTHEVAAMRAERRSLALRPAVWVGVSQNGLSARNRDYSGMEYALGAQVEMSVRNDAARLSALFGLSFRRHDVVFRSGAFPGGLVALDLDARYTFPVRWASPYVGAGFVIGWITGSSQVEDSDSIPAVFSRDHGRHVAESGYAFELGLVRPLRSGPDLVLGLRHERTASFSGEPGTPRFERQTTGLRLGVRF